MWLQIQQLGPKDHSVAQRGDQFPHLPVLRFRIAAGNDRPQFALREGSNLLWVVESKNRRADFLWQPQQVHDLRDAREKPRVSAILAMFRWGSDASICCHSRARRIGCCGGSSASTGSAVAARSASTVAIGNGKGWVI